MKLVDMAVAAICKIGEGKKAILHAVANGNPNKLEALLAMGADVNQPDEKGNAPLRYTIFINPEDINCQQCTLLLLEHHANVNTSYTDFYGKKKTIIQECIDENNISALKILAMYGATVEGVTSSSQTAKAEQLLKYVIKLKQFLDTYLKAAANYEQVQNYEMALSKYQQAGDIWYLLSRHENKNLVFKRHYQQKALELYEREQECYQKVAAYNKTPNNTHAKLFQNLADLYKATGNQVKEIACAKLAASLIEDLKQSHQCVISESSVPHQPVLSSSYENTLKKRGSAFRNEEADPLLVTQNIDIENQEFNYSYSNYSVNLPV